MAKVAATMAATAVLLAAFLWAPIEIASGNQGPDPSSCCDSLCTALPGKVFRPNTTSFDASIASYWSLQESAVGPSCVVSPSSADDVSTAVALLTSNGTGSTSCQFAIRGGGHTPFVGAANIDNGVTIDLSQLNQVTVSPDRATVTVGSGSRWGDVYSTLDPQNLTVPGGRDSTVGVGGLALGGGISFFSPRVGLVCDNIVSYEVVLASGAIATVSKDSNPSLFLALKGGSNNFAIATAFTINAIPSGNFFGGFAGHPVDVLENYLQLFEDFAKSANYDINSALIFSLSYNTTASSWGIASNYEYTQPTLTPPAFDKFLALPQTFSTLRLDSHASFAVELDASSPSGRRQLFSTSTFQNSAAVMKAVIDIANSTVQTLATSVPGVSYSISFQPLPQTIISKSAAAGGNALGLDATDGDLVNVLNTISWDDVAADEAVDTAARDFIDQVTQTAQTMGKDNPYLYLNYAASWQEPIQSYGDESLAQLKAVSQQVDPHGVFQTQVPGGFKLH